MGFWRWVRRKARGVEDLARDAGQHTDPKKFVCYTIDHAPFQKWVVFVAAVGFFTDAYDIFALNVITQILPYVYNTYDGSGTLPQNLQAALLISTLAGTMVGQIVFGLAGDRYGRRKMYGLELIVLIVGSIGTAMSSQGQGSMNIWGWLVVWRLIMGVGIGADYPLSAVIASEFAPRKHRARMLAFVFWMQPVGQVFVLAVALIAVEISKPWLSSCSMQFPGGINGSNDCISNLDSVWRWVVGLGAAPAALAIFFRLSIPQSPRFLMDNKKQVEKAVRNTAEYYGTPEVPFNVQMAQIAPLQESHHEIIHEQKRNNSFELPPAVSPARRLSLNGVESHAVESSSASVVSSASTPVTNQAPSHILLEEEQSWWTGFHHYFFLQGNWRLLAGTAGTWFLLDVPFYGLGLSSASIVGTIWHAGLTTTADQTMYDVLNHTLLHSLVIVVLGGLVGGAIFMKIVKYVSPRTIQLWGFLVLTVLLLVTGVAFPFMANSGAGGGPIVLYVLIQLFFNLGPNTTTYMIPAELFPTQYRCTCHGISAAAGRFGGICAQLFVTFATFNGTTLADGLKAQSSLSNTDGTTTQAQKTLGNILAVFCVFTALGAGLTKLLTPDTRDKAGRPRSLETLARGYDYLKKLNGETAPDDREVDHEN